jgi:hypothetical protein
MTSAPDRQDIVALITEAVDAGARESVACHELSLHPRTYQRWQGSDGEVMQDLRPLAERPSPVNRLSEDERDQKIPLYYRVSPNRLRTALARKRPIFSPNARIVSRPPHRGDLVWSQTPQAFSVR